MQPGWVPNDTCVGQQLVGFFLKNECFVAKWGVWLNDDDDDYDDRFRRGV